MVGKEKTDQVTRGREHRYGSTEKQKRLVSGTNTTAGGRVMKYAWEMSQGLQVKDAKIVPVLRMLTE